MAEQITDKNVRLLNVSKEAAEVALNQMKRICQDSGVSADDMDRFWRYSQLLASYLLIEFGEFPRGIPPRINGHAL